MLQYIKKRYVLLNTYAARSGAKRFPKLLSAKGRVPCYMPKEVYLEPGFLLQEAIYLGSYSIRTQG